jgi:hypothetical protein
MNNGDKFSQKGIEQDRSQIPAKVRKENARTTQSFSKTLVAARDARE